MNLQPDPWSRRTNVKPNPPPHVRCWSLRVLRPAAVRPTSVPLYVNSLAKTAESNKVCHTTSQR